MTTESQQQIAREAAESVRKAACNGISGWSLITHPELQREVEAIILSAIERAKVMWRKGWHECDKCRTQWFTSIDGRVGCPKCQGDTEVREPLVKALEQLRDGDFETPDGNGYTGCSPETERVITGICDDALAKVKEDK